MEASAEGAAVEAPAPDKPHSDSQGQQAQASGPNHLGGKWVEGGLVDRLSTIVCGLRAKGCILGRRVRRKRPTMTVNSNKHPA